MSKQEALAYANKHFSGYNIYIRGDEVLVRDRDELITKIKFGNVRQLTLF